MDDRETRTSPSRHKRPSRGWYLLSLVLLVVSVAVFVLTLLDKASYLKEQIAAMPRFVGPTGEDGFVVTIDQPGKQNIYYENLGSLEGKAFDTPRRQVWTTFAAPSMTCTVTRVETGERIEVLLPGQRDAEAKSRTSEDQIVPYNIGGTQGHSAWVFEAEHAGDYRIVLSYEDEVYLEPGDVQVPPGLTKPQKKEMLGEEGAAYETARRAAIERAALAELEPIDVLFAVGPDPTRGSFFEVIGLKGAATVLAFGFTFAVLISLVTLMLRGGHVTPRGKIEHIRRLGNQPGA